MMNVPALPDKHETEHLIASDAFGAIDACRLNLASLETKVKELSHLIVAVAYRAALVYHSGAQDPNQLLTHRMWEIRPKKPKTVEGWQMLILRYIHGAWGTEGSDWKNEYACANTHRRALRTFAKDGLQSDMSFEQILGELNTEGIKARAKRSSTPRGKSAPKIRLADIAMRSFEDLDEYDDDDDVDARQSVNIADTLLVKADAAKLEEILKFPDNTQCFIRLLIRGVDESGLRTCRLLKIIGPRSGGRA